MDIVNGLIWNAIDGGGGSTTVEQLNVTANGTYTADAGKAYSPVVVNVTPSGVLPKIENDVMFYDYDGTVLYSYSKADFLALNAMPANPSHTGLIAQGWNWSLAGAQSYVTAYGMLDIGQMYVTDDGKTRIYIEIPADAPDAQREFHLQVYSSKSNNCTLDWGDGSPTATVGYANDKVHAHNYAASGSYCITLQVDSGSLYLSCGSSSYRAYGESALANAYNRNRIKKIEIGSGVTKLGRNYLCDSINLSSVSVPNGVTLEDAVLNTNNVKMRHITLPTYSNQVSTQATFTYSYLESISLPEGTPTQTPTVTNSYWLKRFCMMPGTNVRGKVSGCYSLNKLIIPTTASAADFYGADSLYQVEELEIPSNITSIGSQYYNSPFNACHNLRKVTFKGTVTYIANGSFKGCWSLEEVPDLTGITALYDNTFYECYSLGNVTIPAAITSIGSGCFRYCYSLKEVHVQATTPPTIGSNAFDTSTVNADLVIYVPVGTLSAYQTAWSTWASQIQEEPA